MRRFAGRDESRVGTASDVGDLPPGGQASPGGHIAARQAAGNWPQSDGSRFHALLAATPDLIWCVSRECRLLDILENEETPIPLSRENAIGRQISDVLPEGAAHACATALEAAFATGRVQDCEFSLATEQGLRWLDARISASGVEEAVVLIRDVTEQKLAAREIRDHEKQLDAFFTLAPAGLIIFDRDVRIVKISELFGKMYGVDETTFIGKRPTEIWANQLAADVEKDTRAVLRTGKPKLNCEISGETSVMPGVIRYFAYSRFPIRNSDGEVTSVGVILVETTEWKQTQTALRESEERFRAHYQSNPVPIYTWQWDNGDFVLRDFNRAAEHFTHGKVRAMLGGRLSTLYAEMPFIHDSFRRCYESHKPVSHEMQYRFGMHDEVRDLVVRYVFVPPDQIMVHTEDVTAWKQDHRALRESKQQYRQLLDEQVDGVAVVTGGKIVFANLALCRLCGTRSEDLLGRSPLDFLTHESKDRLAERIGLMMGDGNESTIEAVALNNSGDRVPIEVSSRRVLFRGEMTSLLVVRDLTAKKRVEELAQRRQNEMFHVDRLHTLGEMASGIGHELNQPLSAIATYAATCRMLLHSERHPDQIAKLDDLLCKMELQSLRAGQIIHRVRRLAAKGKPLRSLCSINDVIGNAVALIAPEARFRQIDIQLELDVALPAVMADSIGIEQVLLNLMKNAVEAMSEKPARLNRPEDRHCLTVRSARKDSQWITVLVSDTGPGIPAAQMCDVFDAFVTTKPHGTGLGLAVSKTIVEAHDGLISTHKAQGRGVTFEVNLPIAEVV